MIKKKFAKKSLKQISASVLTTAMVLTSNGFDVCGTLQNAQAATNETSDQIQKLAENVNVQKSKASNVLSNEERGVLFANSRTDFRDESIYFLITTRFYDGDSSNNARTSEDKKAQNPEDDPSWRGDFAGLIEKLDYIKALGFTAIWITPVVENDSGYDYHGYHAYNFNAVDKRYESNGITYQDLIDACHAKGMKVIQDIVLNHTCNWGEENLNQITSDDYPTRTKVVMNGTGDANNIYHHNGFCGGGDWDNYSAQDKTIADDCFDLETENPTVYNYLIDAYDKYINMGVDGFRIDTVKHISRLTFNSTFLPAFKKAGGDDFYMFGEVCTKGHDVWYRDCPPISTCFYTWADPQSWTSKWSEDTAANEKLVQDHYAYYNNVNVQSTSNNAILNGNEYHTPDTSQASGMNVIDFQMHWSFNNANSAFNTALGEDRYFNDSTWNVVYVDSHDYGPDECQTLRYNGGTDAWAENLSLMFTFRGIPCIYYGSEIEFQAGKPIDVGPNQPLSQTGRAYYGDNIEGSITSTDFTVFGNVDGKVADTLNSTLSQHIMRLNRIRQSVPALRKGQYSTEGCSGNIAFKRRYTDATTDSFALVAISGDATFTGIPNGTYVDAVTGDTKTVTNGTLSANVSGKANMKVYVLNTAKTPAPGRVIPNGKYLSDGGSDEPIQPVAVKIVDETGVSLNSASVEILEEETKTISATVTPSDATYKTVTWSSSDNSVATVSGGTITGIAPGKATITAKTKKGFVATATVTVKTNPNIIKATGITLSDTKVNVKEKKTVQLDATVIPSNTTNKNVTWSTSNAAIATVDNGVVTGVAKGTATITATTSNGLTATAQVTVEERFTNSSKIYFKNTKGWSSVNAYAWSSGTNNNAVWPGEAMTLVDKENNIYEITLDKDKNFTKIIFNCGGNQTDDLTIPGYDYIYDGSKWEDYSEDEKTGKVLVKYIDTEGNVLDETTISGNVGESYKVTKKSFDGYTYQSMEGTQTGTIEATQKTIKVIYKKDEIDSNPKTPYPTLKAGEGKIDVSWNAVTGATTYRVFTKLNGKFAVVANTTSTNCTVTGLTGGTEYGVLVLAYVDGKWTTFDDNDVKKATPSEDINKIKAIVTPYDAKLQVKWTAIEGASSYRIFTYSRKTGKFAVAANTAVSNCVINGLVNGTEYGVLVLANVDGRWTSFTDNEIVYATPGSAYVTNSTKAIVTLTPGTKSVDVKWSAVTGATQYRVFKYVGGKYTTLTSTSGTSATISGLASGTKCGVLVLSYVNGQWSNFSASDLVYTTVL